MNVFAPLSILLFLTILTIVYGKECHLNHGKCVDSDLCPSKQAIKFGTCKRGDICCKRAKCEDLGGRCSKKCPKNRLRLGKRAYDCRGPYKCCVRF